MLAEREGAVDPLLADEAALLIEPRGRRDARVTFERDIGERIAAPERERLVVGAEGVRVPVSAGRRTSRRGEAHELADIQHAPGRLQHVPRRPRRDRRSLGQRRSQPRHVLVDHVLRAGGTRLAPDAVDQALDRDGLADVEQEDGEDRALTPPAK